MKRRILVVDDQDEWLAFLQNEVPDYTFEIARNSDDALAELQSDNFDLVIANMRRRDILEAIADHFPREQVIVITVAPTAREAALAYRLGALDYFARSFSASDLLNKIERAVRIGQRRRSAMGAASAV
jgi:DNA-binding NtrC family response regulator